MSYGRRWFILSVLLAAGLLLLLVWHSRHGSSARGGTALVVYCAAGIKPPVLEAARQFQNEYGFDIRLQYGGSGTLLSNLQVARSGDLYLAADVSYVEIATQRGLVKEQLPLAFQRPVIAVAAGNPKGIHSVADLLRRDVRVALGNPDAASIGKQTRTYLEKAGEWTALKARVEAGGVFKPTVPEVANDIKLGAVDAGIIWDATVGQYPELEGVAVPEFDAAEKDIVIGVLTASRAPTDALRFARFLNSTRGNEIFKRFGYRSIDGDEWAWHPEITFFCGSVNRRAVEPVVRRFADREGVTVNTVYNGCGILTAQMRSISQEHGGRGFPDLYMACDRYYLENVADWFQEDRDISDAAIVIAVPKGNPKDITGLADLAKPGIRVAVGQPDQCTIGALTRTLLRQEGCEAQVMANVVTQAASSAMLVPSVTTRSVDAAIAYITDTMAAADRIDTISIKSPYARAVQPLSIARSGRHKYLARRLYQAIAGARERFEAAGFNYRLVEEPETPPGESRP